MESYFWIPCILLLHLELRRVLARLEMSLRCVQMHRHWQRYWDLPCLWPKNNASELLIECKVLKIIKFLSFQWMDVGSSYRITSLLYNLWRWNLNRQTALLSCVSQSCCAFWRAMWNGNFLQRKASLLILIQQFCKSFVSVIYVKEAWLVTQKV